MRIQHIVWVACERQNRLVSDVTIIETDVQAALRAVAPEEHTQFDRYTPNDCNGWIGFVSNLGHMFQVQVPIRQDLA